MNLQEALQKPGEILVLNSRGKPLNVASLGKMKSTHLSQCAVTVRGIPLAFSSFFLSPENPQYSFSYAGMTTGQRVDDLRRAEEVSALEALGEAYRIVTNLPIPYITKDPTTGKVIDID